MATINAGIPDYLIEADATAAPFTGVAKALPVLATYGTWTTSYSVAPGAINIVLEASFDGTTWFVIDTSTNVNGEMRNFQTSATQIRARVVSETGGGDITVAVVMKKAFEGAASLASLTISGNASADRYLAGNGTSALPSFAFTSEPSLGFYKAGTNHLYMPAGKLLGFGNYGTGSVAIGAGVSGMNFSNTAGVKWSGNTNEQGTSDVGLSRIAAGVLGVGTGAIGSVAGTISSDKHLAGDGSAAAPSYSFTANPNIGFYNNAGSLFFASGGVSRAYIDSGGITSLYGVRATGVFTAGDGTALLPAFAFSSEPTLGFWRSAATTIQAQGIVKFFPAGIQVAVIDTVGISTSGANIGLRSNSTGVKVVPHLTNEWIVFQNNANTIGNTFKVDALPTIASGFGTGAAIVAGSTPLAGAVNVGTGGVATSGTINFGGTAFPSPPFAVVSNPNTNAHQHATPSTTQLVLTSSVAWNANDIVSWICISPK